MNDSFGVRLRRERERKQITLAHIAKTTKIQASLFEGLERDDVSRWPGGIFRRSFVRAYAQAIGLDPEQTCREFVERFPEPGDLPADAATAGAIAAQTTAAAGIAPFRSARTAIGQAATRTWAAASDDRDGDDEPTGHVRLRLTLADHGLPPAARRVSADPLSIPGPASRWRAVALDLGTVLIVGLTAFIALGDFWMPLAFTSVVYYFGSTLLFGTTPGVRFFADTSVEDTGAAASSTTTSLERALELRDVLVAEARPRSLSTPLRQPVDIDSRRVRA